MARRFHGLKRIKLRQSWNKHNLYNLWRYRDARVQGTFYQQKWAAKSATRAFHGEQIGERKWEHLFTSRINSVVEMDHRYLATQDGSEQAEGRGSGLEEAPEPQYDDYKDADEQPTAQGSSRGRKRIKPTPYMSMTYAPTERRLDTAIFRAMFASSTRQARQFVVHGGVKVNGQKMIYPGYLLNPGDMFQVDVERVLFATGVPKTTDIEQVRDGRLTRGIRSQNNRARRLAAEARKAKQSATAEAAEAAGKAITTKVEPQAPVELEGAPLTEEREYKVKEVLRKLYLVTKETLNKKKNKPSAQRKQELRALQAQVKVAMKKAGHSDVSFLHDDMEKLMEKLTIASRPKGQSEQEARDIQEREVKDKEFKEQQEARDGEIEPVDDDAPGLAALSEEERIELREMLKDAKENPEDPTKPYATPWRPRNYMSPFAFIPRYLEVNQKICSAVYLRNPVARPGLAEVPSPFTFETQQLAFNWYLRRR